MSCSVKVFSTPFELAEALAFDLVNKIKEAGKRKSPFTVALSGGNTPTLLFSVLGDHFSNTVKWNMTHFFWVDERCVLPDNPQSNYGIAKQAFLRKIDIPDLNIHRMKGEDNPEKEAVRYSDEIKSSTRSRNGLPVFDLILLGMGEDGHTASIFPGNEKLLHSDKVCEVAIHPVTGQKRITLTGKIINNAESIVFHVTGKNKADVLKKVLNDKNSKKQFPASFIDPVNGKLFWYLDKEAGSLLDLASEY